MNRKSSLLLIAVLLIAGCGGGSDELPADAYQAQSDTVVAMAVVTSTSGDSADTPDGGKPDRKVGDKCDNYNGSGRSGDGLGRCNVCKGDGRIDADDIRASSDGPRLLDVGTDAAAPAATPADETLPITIELHVSQASASGWAEWWHTERPLLESQGIAVSYTKESEGEAWLKVCGKTCARVDGKPTREQLNEIIKRVTR